MFLKILQILLFIATNMTDISWGCIQEIDFRFKIQIEQKYLYLSPVPN